jgi:hypothetical protein
MSTSNHSHGKSAVHDLFYPMSENSGTINRISIKNVHIFYKIDLFLAIFILSSYHNLINFIDIKIKLKFWKLQWQYIMDRKC